MRQSTKPARLYTRSNDRIDVMQNNVLIGYCEDQTLYGIGADTYAEAIGKVSHRVEIIPKLMTWRATKQEATAT